MFRFFILGLISGGLVMFTYPVLAQFTTTFLDPEDLATTAGTTGGESLVLDGSGGMEWTVVAGGGGGASSTIIKIDGTVSNTNVPTLDFNSGEIAVTESPTDEFNLSVSDNITFSNTTTTNATTTNLAVTGAFNFLGTWITNVSTWFNGLFDTQLATKDTGDLTEGSNLYYTLARVQSALVSGYNAVFGNATSTNLTVTGTLAGNLTGNADTATSLSANGSNCSAGNAPLGVDENGAVEGCYDVFTQAENDSAGYLTSYTETDPIWIASSSEYFSLSAWGATTTDGLNQGATNLYNQTHSGEVMGATSLTVADNVIDEANLKINTPTDNYILVASSTATGGLEWVATSTARLGFGTGGSINSLEDIADVASMSKTAGDVLYWNGSAWTNTATTTWATPNGLATSTPISDTEIIYGTSASTVGSESTFTYDDSLNKLSVENASITNSTSTNIAVTGYFSLLGDVITNVATWFDSKIEALTNVVLQGVWNFGGATSIEIVNGTNPTVDTTGEIALDTSGSQIIVSTNGATTGIIPARDVKIWSATFASTSDAFIAGGLLPVPTQLDGYTISRIQCHVTGGTSKVIAVEDASANSSENITCATTNTTDDGSITNATYTASELSYIDFGATTGSVNYVSISVFGNWTRE